MDQIDRRILSALQSDALRKNADLPKDLGLSPSSTLERVRRLEERGLFKSFRAVLDPQQLGLTVQALVSGGEKITFLTAYDFPGVLKIYFRKEVIH